MLQNAIHRPNISEWPKRMQTKWTVAEILAMPRSKADAKATPDLLGEPATFYYRGKLCNARKHFAPQYTRGGRCAVCKFLENQSRTSRKQRKQDGLNPSTVATSRNRTETGIGGTSSGWGTVVYPKFMTPGPDARAALKAKLATKPKHRGKPIPGWVMDHTVHTGWPLPEGALIIGREVAANRKLMTQSQNTLKGNQLPDPNDWSRAAGRPLSVAEHAEFVRRGMAFWIHDLLWDADGKLIGVRRELYIDDLITGLTTYVGQEPAA